MHLTLTMTKTFLRIFSRDRQAIFFSVFFPILFMAVFGLVGDANNDPMPVGIVNNAGNPLAAEFIADLGANSLFRVTVGIEAELRAQIIKGEQRLVLVLPPNFEDNGNPADLTLLVDASQVRELAMVMPVLEQALVDVERTLRNTEPLFNLQVEDVKARSQNYLDFLVPGLLAFTIMQISIAGSGYNIVEFRRKGILKRLFVTPLEPHNFIGALVLSRALICLVQLTVLLAVAVFLLGVSITGDFTSLYVVIILGIALFLSLGFCLGSIAKTQQAIGALGSLFTFPQMFLAGIFYPIDILPALVQPIAQLLPLSFVVNGLREIAVNGASLFDILPTLLGLTIWTGIALILAIRMFVWKEVAS